MSKEVNSRLVREGELVQFDQELSFILSRWRWSLVPGARMGRSHKEKSKVEGSEVERGDQPASIGRGVCATRRGARLAL